MKTIMKLAWALMAGLVLVGTASTAFAERERGDRGQKMDTDGDGYVSQAEFEGSRIGEFVNFSDVDTDGDGQLSKTELQEIRKNNPRGGRERDSNEI